MSKVPDIGLIIAKLRDSKDTYVRRGLSEELFVALQTPLALRSSFLNGMQVTTEYVASANDVILTRMSKGSGVYDDYSNSNVSKNSSLETKQLSSSVRSTSHNLVETATTLRNLKRLSDSVELGCPILVQGEVGCGKSFLIRELATLNSLSEEDIGGGLVELHLDDQTDSKALLGAYVCSDVPGEFLWQPGVVTQAALSGRWLVIEDVDRVPLEVLASLSALLERR